MIAAYSGVLFTPQSKVLVQLLRRSICRRAAVQLVESCLAKQPDYPRPRQFHRPAEDIQIEKPSTRCVEALVGTTKRGPHLLFQKERVRFLCRKNEPSSDDSSGAQISNRRYPSRGQSISASRSSSSKLCKSAGLSTLGKPSVWRLERFS